MFFLHNFTLKSPQFHDDFSKPSPDFPGLPNPSNPKYSLPSCSWFSVLVFIISGYSGEASRHQRPENGNGTSCSWHATQNIASALWTHNVPVTRGLIIHAVVPVCTFFYCRSWNIALSRLNSAASFPAADFRLTVDVYASALREKYFLISCVTKRIWRAKSPAYETNTTPSCPV